MTGFGTLVNTLSIGAGALVGLLAHNRLSHKIRDLVIQGMALATLATGGVLLIAIGFNLLKITEKEKAIPLGDFLPSLFLAPIFAWLAFWIRGS